LTSISSNLAQKRVLWITRAIGDHPIGGREGLSSALKAVLFSLLEGRLCAIDLPRYKLMSFDQIINGLRGYIDGINVDTSRSVLQFVRHECISTVLIDGSNLGKLATDLKLFNPKLRVICFFHNVEARFFWGAVRSRPSLRALAIFICNYLAERKAVKNSDVIITLTRADSEELYRWYRRPSSYIVPLALRDQVKPNMECIEGLEDAMLFVGGNFYANRSGIEWFIRHVMPFVKGKLFVVGQGMEVIHKTNSLPDRVEVVGGVDDLGKWYRRARFAVAPIFDGSGMKTKVAEALMHGKRIVGTPAAFVGYEAVLPSAGWICRDSSEFIKAIQAAQLTDLPAVDSSLRQLYLDHYSLEAATKHFERILSS